MIHKPPTQNLLQRFHRILKISESSPDIDLLHQIVKSFLTKIPFETISKLYYKNKYNLRSIPDFELYLDGIEKYNFGGTCYSNNYYMNLLLKFLGYDVMLCGADMDNPDVHLVNIVTLDKYAYLVDVGYGAPFFEAIHLSLNKEFAITLGNDKYVINPKDSKENTRVDHYRNEELIHGYTAKPIDRTIDYFANVFAHSFDKESEFMNNILLAHFSSGSSVVLNNLTLVNIKNKNIKVTKLDSHDELPEIIAKHFQIPAEITRIALTELKSSEDSWR